MFLKHHFVFRQTCSDTDNQGEEQEEDHNSDEIDELVMINLHCKKWNS